MVETHREGLLEVVLQIRGRNGTLRAFLYSNSRGT